MVDRTGEGEMSTISIIITIILCSIILFLKLKKLLQKNSEEIVQIKHEVGEKFKLLDYSNIVRKENELKHIDKLYNHSISQGIEIKTLVLRLSTLSPTRFFLITYSYVSPTTKTSTRGRITLQTDTFPNEQEIRTLVSNEHKIQHPIIDGLIEFKSESDYKQFIKVD